MTLTNQVGILDSKAVFAYYVILYQNLFFLMEMNLIESGNVFIFSVKISRQKMRYRRWRGFLTRFLPVAGEGASANLHLILRLFFFNLL